MYSSTVGGWMFLGIITPRLTRDTKPSVSPFGPPRVRLVCHLWMPAGGVTMKMAMVGLPAASREKRQ